MLKESEATHILKRALFSLFAVVLTAMAATAQQASPVGSAQSGAQPNVYRSTKGYGLTYPSGWLIANAKDRATMREAGSQFQLNFDLSDVDVLIHAPSTDLLRSITVNVSPYIVPATQYYLDKYKKLLPQELSKSGANSPPLNLDVRLTKVGRYDAIVATWNRYMPGAGSIWQEQFMIAGKSHTFIVTCTSEADSSAATKLIFDKILASFQIDKEALSVGSGRIHQILEDAKARQPEDSRIRAAFQEVLARQPRSFSEFRKQCADLKTVLDESDVMEKKKRQMLADLRAEFGDDVHVKAMFDTLSAIEDASDKMEPIWRGMIACSDVLESAPSSKQNEYDEICVQPAQQQINLIAPEISKLVQRLQSEAQKYGASLPPDVLQAIAQ